MSEIDSFTHAQLGWMNQHLPLYVALEDMDLSDTCVIPTKHIVIGGGAGELGFMIGFEPESCVRAYFHAMINHEDYEHYGEPPVELVDLANAYAPYEGIIEYNTDWDDFNTIRKKLDGAFRLDEFSLHKFIQANLGEFIIRITPELLDVNFYRPDPKHLMVGFGNILIAPSDSYMCAGKKDPKQFPTAYWGNNYFHVKSRYF